MELVYLDWDSGFFSKKIYKLLVQADLREEELLELKKLEADLVYIYAVSPITQTDTAWQSIGAELYDRKVTYEKAIMNSTGDSQYNITFETVASLTPAIIDMAYQSGVYSRFRLDPRLSYKFRELYYTWILKSVQRQLADEVFVARNENGDEMGFITLSNRDKKGTIGLIAVDEKFRGRKVASQLLARADEWFRQTGVERCEVVTQLDNVPACQLYEKAGYIQKKIEHIYHYWKA